MPQVDDADDARVSLARRRPPKCQPASRPMARLASRPAVSHESVHRCFARSPRGRSARPRARSMLAKDMRDAPSWRGGRGRQPTARPGRPLELELGGYPRRGEFAGGPRPPTRGTETAPRPRRRCAPSSTRATHQLVPHTAPLTLAAPRRAVENPSDGPGPGRPGRRPAAGARPREGKGGEGAPEEGLRGAGPRPIPVFERARANYPPAKELPRARARLRDRRRARPS